MVRNAPKHESGVQRIGLSAFVAEKLHIHFVNECWAFNAQGGPVLHRFSCSIEMVWNAPKNDSRVQRIGLGTFVAEKLLIHFVNECWAFNALGGPVLHRFLCSNEKVRNAPKHEYGVQWSGLGSFITKKHRIYFVSGSGAFNALGGPVLHHFSCSIERFRKTPNHESGVQRSVLGTFVA